MKKILSIGAAVLGAAAFFGFYQYFRTPESALEATPEVIVTSAEFGQALRAGTIKTGDFVQLSGEVIAAESSSLELRGGVLITRAQAQQNTPWPESGMHSFKCKFNGVEVDEFFGDTLYRLNDGFLLDAANSEDLD